MTGGADGLGFAIARRIAAEGATVWLLDRDAARVQEAASRVGAQTFAAAVHRPRR